MATTQYEITLAQTSEEFAAVAAEHPGGGPRFAQEQAFAVACLQENSLLAATAKADPGSLTRAMLRLAGTGLSLNPALAYCYLVPRDKKVSLDIGYRGLIKIHTDAGVIDSIHADTVYSGDQWDYEERDEGPHLIHKRPRLGGDRGELEGAYVRAVLPSGRVVVTTITLAEYEAVKRMSPAARKNTGPHMDWRDEMIKAKVIKRASKTWPKADIHGAEAAALNIAADTEGDQPKIGPDQADNVTPAPEPQLCDFITQDQAEQLERSCGEAEIDLDIFCGVYQIGCLEELPAEKFDEATARLDNKRQVNAAARKGL